MQDVEASSQAWQKAVSILDAKEELTGSEKVQLAEYRTSLKASRDKVSAEKLRCISPHQFEHHPVNDPKVPWVVAEKRIHTEMQEGRYDTSVGVLASNVMQRSDSIQMRVIYFSNHVCYVAIPLVFAPLILLI